MTPRPLAFALSLLIWGGPALAGARDLVGGWAQVSSTGGDCSSCALSISEKGERIEARASNGWTAELVSTRDGRRAAAVGTGVWPNWGNRPLRIILVASGPDELSMQLEIKSPDGRISRVEAVFQRKPTT